MSPPATRPARIESPSAPGPATRSRAADPTEAILEAAVRCFARTGIERTRVEEIAREAGIVRPNVYRYFASKDAIVHEVVLRQIRSHHHRLRERYPLRGPAADLIVKALVSGIQESALDSFATVLISHEAAATTATLLRSSLPIAEAISEYWVPVLTWAREQGELRPDVVIADAVRWLTFLQFSYLTLPELAARGARLRGELRQFVVPALLVTD